jgi:glutathione S-transferase
MKLFYSPTSPYARKVLVTAHELGLFERLDLAVLDPWKDPPELLAATPFAKVPALVTDDAITLTESTAICEYLSLLADIAPLTGAAWLDNAVRVGVAQGLTDAGLNIVVEGRRPAETQSSSWRDRLTRAIIRAMKVARVGGTGFDAGNIALACALAYLDFRLPNIGWRQQRPDLAAWLDDVDQRPSMLATRP